VSLTMIKRGFPQVRTRYSLKHLSCVRFIFNGENPTRKTTLPGKRTHNLDCWVYIYQYFQYVNDLCHIDENVGVLFFSSIKLNAGSICSMNTDWSVPFFFTLLSLFSCCMTQIMIRLYWHIFNFTHIYLSNYKIKGHNTLTI